MGRRLAAWVHVPDETGATVAFGPDDEVPAWAAEKITNPKAWAAEPAPDGDVVEPAPMVGASGGSSLLAPLEKPPAHGAGSGTANWIAYARSIGLDIADNASQGDAIEAVEAHEQNQK